MNVILFEDSAVDQLQPLTTLRPAYSVQCGGQSLIDELRNSSTSIQANVREFLWDLQAAEYHDVMPADWSANAPHSVWLINARMAPAAGLMDTLQSCIHDPKITTIFPLDGALAAAHIAAGHALPKSCAADDVAEWITRDQPAVERLPKELNLMRYPHDVISLHEQLLPGHLDQLIVGECLTEIADGVFVEADVRLPKDWHADASHGPIVLRRGCSVGPFSVLLGPVLVGPAAKVNEHAALKHAVSIGEHAKVGGEIEASVIESFANKQHFGFLGHSYIGHWVNLGAGTSNSDLKNTYGTVRVTHEGQKIDTGRQFLGCMVGDYSKSSIHTAIFTGKTIGVASMLYGQVSQDVPAFVNYIPHPGLSTQISLDVIVAMQYRMFQRRGRAQQPYHVQLFRHALERTAAHRAELPIHSPQF